MLANNPHQSQIQVSPGLSCNLSEWGLPPLIVGWFKKKGISSLFKWQVECLCRKDVLFGANLVYSAPTSAGKTLVADFLLLKKVLEYGKKALVIEPFVALTREKGATLKSMLYTTKARVGAFGGAYYTPGGMAAVSVAVCTIEKANNFINKLINEEKLSELGIIIVDEIHYVGDERRGHQLELLLTKVLYHNSKREINRRIQIVGLSATIPNLVSIARWLNAALYVTDYRPVPLVEKIKLQDKIYDIHEYLQNPDPKPLETITRSDLAIEKDHDDLCYLCIQSIINGHSILMFCESKRDCEIMAGQIADQILKSGSHLNSDNPRHVEVSQKLRDNLSAAKIKDLMTKLKKCPAGPDRELFRSIKFGVAFHHAGLTSEEREIIEDGFKAGAVKALLATSTLSSGVNLPARRVVIRSPMMISSNSSTFQREMLNPITYRQMIGRAGRQGIDTCGESILICGHDNQDVALKLIRSSLGNIKSSLGDRMLASEGEPSGLKKAVLEVVANGTAVTREQLSKYLLSTFWLSSDEEQFAYNSAISATLYFLKHKKFIEELKPGEYRPTRLGNAVLSSGLHPDDSLELLQDLIRARQGFCLLNDLHIIYQVTPNDIARSVDLKDWQHYSKVWNALDDTSQYVGQRVGVDEVVIARRCQGFSNLMEEDKERVYKRFWISLVINDLVNEIPLAEICQKYRMSKALVQQAQRAVAQFAGVMSIFCQELGYSNIAALVTPLESRINFSCQRDLLELIKLNITRPIARSLFSAGYRTIIAVAKADKLDIEFAIRQIQPFKKEQSFSEKATPTMWVPELAKTMTTLDYASHIVDTARSFVEIEYDIDLTPIITKRKESEADSSSYEPEQQMDPESPVKRGRIDNGENNNVTTLKRIQTDSDDMVRVNRDAPSFEVKYIGDDDRDIDDFIDRWLIHSNISINFKIEEQTNDSIGANVKRLKKTRKTARRNSRSEGSDEGEDDYPSQDGLALRLDIDNKKHIVTRLYACFDDDYTVFVLSSGQALARLRHLLPSFLNKSARSKSAKQLRNSLVTVKLFTQNIVMTYKVLYAAFGIEELILNTRFEWHSFDVAWWMISDCPNRGYNNCNSSLSLVSKTKWARKYHHFLYPSSSRKKSRRSPVAGPSTGARGQDEYMRFKDIVKSGKTAILKPLIEEILIELANRNQIYAYNRAEIPSRLSMAQTMIHGMGLDMKIMRSELSLYEDLSDQLTDIAQKYYAKSTISLTNIRHVARVLYEDLDLKKYLLNHATNSDISKDPTNSEILNILSEYHPFPKLVQDFRKIGKALDALQSANTHARFNNELNMMRVFGQCDFWQLTGRVSMYDPDLFLINRNFTVTIPAHGNRPVETVQCAPRGCFVPIPGWILVAADYSQLELRLLAHFSDDRNLLEILNRSLDSDENYDVFKTVASKVYQIPAEQITSSQRQHAKQICYGIIYGMGNRTLANHLSVDVERADQFRGEFFNAFPKIQTYTEELIADCEDTGFVESLLGRRRIIEGIRSEHSSIKARAKRVAINTRIQSSASDIIKLAMSNFNQTILEDFRNQARLVLEMHDELIYEVDPAILSEFATSLKTTMEHIETSQNLRVKLLVNLKKGTDWSNIEEFTPSLSSS